MATGSSQGQETYIVPCLLQPAMERQGADQCQRGKTALVMEVQAMSCLLCPAYQDYCRFGISLVVQWLRPRAPNTGGPSSIPDKGTRVHMPKRRPGTAKHTHTKKRLLPSLRSRGLRVPPKL